MKGIHSLSWQTADISRDKNRVMLHKFIHLWGTLRKKTRTFPLQSWRRDLCVQSHFKGGAKKIHPNLLRCWMMLNVLCAGKMLEAKPERPPDETSEGPVPSGARKCPPLLDDCHDVTMSRCYITKIKIFDDFCKDDKAPGQFSTLFYHHFHL